MEKLKNIFIYSYVARIIHRACTKIHIVKSALMVPLTKPTRPKNVLGIYIRRVFNRCGYNTAEEVFRCDHYAGG